MLHEADLAGSNKFHTRGTTASRASVASDRAPMQPLGRRMLLDAAIKEQVVELPGLGAHLLVPQSSGGVDPETGRRIREFMWRSVSNSTLDTDAVLPGNRYPMFVVTAAAPKWSPAFATTLVQLLRRSANATIVVLEGATSATLPPANGADGG